MNDGEKQPDREPWKVNLPFAKIGKYLAFDLEIPSTIVGALLLGYLADAQFGTTPWVTVSSAVLGFVGAVYRLLKYLKHFSKDGNES